MVVAVCGRRLYALDETLSLMVPSGRHLRLRGDVTNPDVRRGMRDFLWESWGGLDVLVNNAGVVPVGPLACTTDAELEAVMSTNVVAPLALTRELLPLLRRVLPSRVVNVGSMFGDIPYPLFAAYSASKFALRGLSIALRRELRAYGVGVTYAAPRATRTDAALGFENLAAPLQMRLDEPERVAFDIWRAVMRDEDTAYAKGAERFFVLVQRLMPRLIDRAVAAQMADPRVRDYLGQRYEAAKARAGRLINPRGGGHLGPSARASRQVPVKTGQPA
jgi:NAD(P)-dependent dehydrogenase (short-subunit alcohol dehydrogenase family)